jgi:large subunit ribosomal protein L19
MADEEKVVTEEVTNETAEDTAEETTEDTAAEDTAEETGEDTVAEDTAEKVEETPKAAPAPKAEAKPAYIDPLKLIAQDSIKAEPPKFEIGSTVKVHVKIREGERERVQIFEGTVIARNGSGVSETFTVRRLSYGVGVERVFPVHSPNVDKVETVRFGRIRRAKLYYLRDRVGKAAKVRERLR